MYFRKYFLDAAFDARFGMADFAQSFANSKKILEFIAFPLRKNAICSIFVLESPLDIACFAYRFKWEEGMRPVCGAHSCCFYENYQEKRRRSSV